MLTSVLGAPGAGKSAVAGPLRDTLPTHVVLDWDAFMTPASTLAGREVKRSPTTWPAYRRLVRAAVDAVVPAPLVLLGVGTPDELADWPIDAWILLDCEDGQRRRRLASRLQACELEDAVSDAARYRALGLPVVDSTGRTPEAVAVELARHVRRLEG